MAKIGGFIVLLLIVALLGGTTFLAFWDIPPPSARVERTLPDDQFPR